MPNVALTIIIGNNHREQTNIQSIFLEHFLTHSWFPNLRESTLREIMSHLVLHWTMQVNYEAELLLKVIKYSCNRDKINVQGHTTLQTVNWASWEYLYFMLVTSTRFIHICQKHAEVVPSSNFLTNANKLTK